MKWLFLILFIGCGANAVNFSKKVNFDDDIDEDDIDENEKHCISLLKEETLWNKKEQLYWAITSIVFLILFIISM
ncbi:hypothetical protein ACVRWQ_00400 [Streptococcus phocae subsp. salmonis]|uniref:hypothetical protein n=1 Tax=Streptococcus phocae TaxID=119224 RepID=UPI00053155A4|nr:hypothetical protein [Streptococcus phocae]KGR72986.1 hypothetical protein NX86_03335 [Streptococcus phocae subsp. salmonis]